MAAWVDIRFVENRWLTVAGEPVEVPAPDWRERMDRNGRRALAHMYRGITCKTEPFEPLDLWVTPQVPDPHVYFFRDRQVYVGHPVTIAQLKAQLEKLCEHVTALSRLKRKVVLDAASSGMYSARENGT